MSAAKRPYVVYHFGLTAKDQAGLQLGEAYFRSCTGLKSETEVVPIQEGGFNSAERKLIGRTKFPNIVLKRGFANGAWWSRRMNFADGEHKISQFKFTIGMIHQYGPGGKIAQTWTFRNGWICKWEGPDYDASKNEIAIETIEIAHEGFEKG